MSLELNGFFLLHILAALVQPSVATSQEAVKDSPFGTMIPPTTIHSGFMASAIPGAGMFNPVGVQPHQATPDKTSSEGVDTAAELTLQGEEVLTRDYSFSLCFCWLEKFFSLWLRRNLTFSFVLVSPPHPRYAECSSQWDGSPWHASISLPPPPAASIWPGWTENAWPAASGRAS